MMWKGKRPACRSPHLCLCRRRARRASALFDGDPQYPFGIDPFDPGHSIQIGIRTHAPADYGIEVLDAAALDPLGVGGVIERIRRRVGHGAAYLSFDIDCLDPAFA